ncbi:MAG: FAD/NAD(P)-binding protein [bacterium]|nr:FAD/NAD(P)-binding protein [bacterium]
MIDWLIIGGGPHGVHAAARLVGEAGVPTEAVRILDDEEVLLARWRRCTRNTGMRYLRSPAVHHLDLSSASLQRFSKSGRGRRFPQPFTRPYSRPSLELFDRHCDEVVTRLGLEDLHVRGRAESLEITEELVRIGVRGMETEGEHESIEAKRVILALGAPERPEWPEWAMQLSRENVDVSNAGSIQHVFDPGFDLRDDPEDEAIAVVGAGISGAQVALRLAREGRRVVLLSRHPLRIHQFDSDPGWQGPKYMAGFSRLRDLDERRRRIGEARHRGSIPPDVESALRMACADGRIEHLEGVEVESATLSEGRPSLEVGGRSILVDRVLLATGFPRRRPGEGWLDDAIEKHDLPCAECGYPVVDRGLRWHPRLLVTGPLAELEIGPVSRNLSGAMRAGERIAAVARTDLVY